MSAIFLLLPALNESAALARLIPEAGAALKATGQHFEIIVINDGSTDRTSALIQELSSAWPVRELKHDRNKGYGAALSTAFEWALDHGASEDLVLAMDADNTHPPRYLPDLIKALEGGAGAVTASYSLPGSAVFGVPPLRKLTSIVCNGLFRIFFPYRGVRTYTNGFRGYRISALRKALDQFGRPLIQEPGFPGGVELFLKVLAAGARAAEIPFELHYENRGGDSKIRIFRTIAGYLRLLVRRRAVVSQRRRLIG